MPSVSDRGSRRLLPGRGQVIPEQLLHLDLTLLFLPCGLKQLLAQCTPLPSFKGERFDLDHFLQSHSVNSPEQGAWDTLSQLGP